MNRYSVEIISDDISENEPFIKASEDDVIMLTSFGFCAVDAFKYGIEYVAEDGKHNLHDVYLFRDDIDKRVIFDLIMMLKEFGNDAWYGILALKVNEKDKAEWEKIGIRYYGSASDYDGFCKFLKLVSNNKESIYKKYPWADLTSR
jgi:hypothetical protein